MKIAKKQWTLLRKQSLWAGALALACCCLAFVVLSGSPDAPVNNMGEDGASDEELALLSERKRKMRGKLRMDAPDAFAEFHRSIRTREGAVAPEYPPNYRVDALKQAHVFKAGNRQRIASQIEWTERGPSNVSGRARAILVDPDDTTHRTWFVGSASGGVWKTEDAGETWREMTREVPNLATTTLAMPASDPNIIYAGTGEGFGTFAFVYGQGIWKSEDKGESWTQLGSTANDIRFTNTLRLAVDPANPQLLLAATSTGLRGADAEQSYLMRSSDGGASWQEVYQSVNRVEQVLAHPEDFDVLYASVNERGVLKSTDGGMNWVEIFDPFYQVGRMELAIAPSNPDAIYVSAEAGFFDGTLFMSRDAGASWEILDQQVTNPPDWLGDLGWYSNAIAVDPEDETRVFVAGLDIYQLDLTEVFFDQGHVSQIIEFDPSNLFKLDQVVNAPATAYRLGRVPGITSAEFIEAEIRWGPGKSQKVHRFVEKWVGEYRDYIDVPFEVWDVQNNRQLMAAFGDEDRDGLWDISDALVSASERIFIIDEPYSATSPHIPTTLNAFESAHYVVTLAKESDDEIQNGPFPEATLRVVPDIRSYREADVAQITAGYDGDPLLTKGVHVDHHQLLFVPSETQGAAPMLLNANDGGIAVSYDMGQTFTQTGDTFSQLYDGIGTQSRPLAGLNTAQFYGVDKMNGANRFVGGTQDNGSWVSPLLQDNEEPWALAPSGDGFEAVWHYTNPDWIIQSSQFNQMFRSQDRGQSWENVTPPGNSVFLTRLAKSNQNPNLLFATTPSGVVRSGNFGSTWSRIDLVNIWPIGANSVVRISLASPNVVWTGATFGGGTPMFVSQDAGVSFDPVITSNEASLGAITNIATHPLEPQTAFALFSMAGTPKIMKTEDLGASWEELSGFGTNGVSANGFPDVAVYSLLVMPFDTDVLWAGTEIGIFESRDGGASWQILDDVFPAVAVWQMRIVNDQVVIATHGRGIWTATLPELETYEPTDHTLSPELLALEGGANGQLNLRLVRRAQYDSTLVFVDGQQMARLENNTVRDTVDLLVDLQQMLDGVAETTVDFTAWSYVNGQAMPAAAQARRIFATDVPVDRLDTNFEDGSASFFLEGFNITTVPGFSSTALHSPHPYADFQDVRATLRTPIRVNAADPSVSYDEIVLVEAGKSEAAFGTPPFYDYVVLEGSTDNGLSWVPVTEGYDVRYNSLWENQQDLTATPDELLTARHEISLLDRFQDGDEVLLRFRMVTDNAVAGWGWMIDNLRIQSSLPISTEENLVPDTFALLPGYPNPFQTETVLSYTLPEPSAVTLSIYDMQGRQVQVLAQHAQQPAGKHTVRWDGKTTWGTPVASGVYFSRLEAGNAFTQTRQLVKVR